MKSVECPFNQSLDQSRKTEAQFYVVDVMVVVSLELQLLTKVSVNAEGLSPDSRLILMGQTWVKRPVGLRHSSISSFES